MIPSYGVRERVFHLQREEEVKHELQKRHERMCNH